MVESSGSGWKDALQRIIREHLGHSSKRGKELSAATKRKRADFLFNFFSRLRTETPYRFDDPRSLKDKHVEAMLEIWRAEGMSASTISSNLSTLRIFCAWIGKAGMVRSVAYYQEKMGLPARRYVSEEDKSWTSRGVDPLRLIEAVEADDPYVAMQLRASFYFGLRRKEAIRFKPWAADMGDSLYIFEGTKGGRPRVLPITTEEQRRVLDEMKAFVKRRSDSLGDPALSLVQAVDRLKYILRKHGVTGGELGVTMHGLRHQYLNDRYEAIAGHPSPVRGGGIVDVEKDQLARRITTEEAGHSRLNITPAYYGSLDARKSRQVVEYRPGEAYVVSGRVRRLKTMGGLANITLNWLPESVVRAMGIGDGEVDVRFVLHPDGSLRHE